MVCVQLKGLDQHLILSYGSWLWYTVTQTVTNIKQLKKKNFCFFSFILFFLFFSNLTKESTSGLIFCSKNVYKGSFKVILLLRSLHILYIIFTKNMLFRTTVFVNYYHNKICFAVNNDLYFYNIPTKTPFRTQQLSNTVTFPYLIHLFKKFGEILKIN